MEYFDTVDWRFIWHILKDIILPHTGTLIFNIVLFSSIGFIFSILYSYFLYKKKIFKRLPRYYNWIVKLHIPLGIVGFLYFFGHIGFIRGVYKILNKESENIVTSIYNNVLDVAFESEESKNDLIYTLQASAIEFRDGSDGMTLSLKKTMISSNTGSSLIDKSKNKVTEYLIDTYGDEIYKIVVYAMLNKAAPHVNINESMSYDVFSTGMDFLLEVGHEDIEKVVKAKLTVWLKALFKSQYTSLIWTYVLLLLLMMCLPLIEFFIYKLWVEPKYIAKIKIED